MSMFMMILGFGYLFVFAIVGCIIWAIYRFIKHKTPVDKSAEWIDGYNKGQADARRGIYVTYERRQ